MRTPRWLCSLLVATSMVQPLGCDTTGRKSRQPGSLPSVADETGQGKCKVSASSSKPLVVEWAAADRTSIEAGSRRGLVAVRYEGCEMELLPGCVLPGKYGYIATTAKRENVKVTSQDELYAHMPVGAVRLEAELAREGQLDVEMMIVGRLDADNLDVSAAGLPASCARATHLVAGITVGAFQFYAGRGLSAGAGVDAGNVGAGAKTQRDRSLLSSDGDITACTAASAADPSPPAQCSAMLRLEVVPIAPAPSPSPIADAGAITPVGHADLGPFQRPSRSEIANFVAGDPDLSRRYRRTRSAIVAGAVLLPVGAVAMAATGGIAATGGGGEWVAVSLGLFGTAAIAGVVLLAAGIPLRRRVLREAEERMTRRSARVELRAAADGLALRF